MLLQNSFLFLLNLWIEESLLIFFLSQSQTGSSGEEKMFYTLIFAFAMNSQLTKILPKSGDNY